MKEDIKMQIKIEIDENYIAEIVSQEVARKIVTEHTYENREAKKGIRDAVDKSIQKYIYSRKEEIIDRIIERASVEVVKKGLPKFIEVISKQKFD